MGPALPLAISVVLKGQPQQPDERATYLHHRRPSTSIQICLPIVSLVEPLEKYMLLREFCQMRFTGRSRRSSRPSGDAARCRVPSVQRRSRHACPLPSIGFHSAIGSAFRDGVCAAGSHGSTSCGLAQYLTLASHRDRGSPPIGVRIWLTKTLFRSCSPKKLTSPNLKKSSRSLHSNRTEVLLQLF